MKPLNVMARAVGAMLGVTGPYPETPPPTPSRAPRRRRRWSGGLSVSPTKRGPGRCPPRRHERVLRDPRRPGWLRRIVLRLWIVPRAQGPGSYDYEYDILRMAYHGEYREALKMVERHRDYGCKLVHITKRQLVGWREALL